MDEPEQTKAKDRVVICGGGVIGACIAYYLSLKNVDVIVVERTGVANASSGKSGGFLALDWCQGTVVDLLARRSFALHAELAATLSAEMGLDWGYRPIDTLSVVASQQRDVSRYARLESPTWLGANSAVNSKLGTEQTTAQLDPAQFTRCMMSAAEAHGATLRIGAVQGLSVPDNKAGVNGVLVDNELIECSKVVIAMGPWSILATSWLPLPEVYGLKGHSLIFRYQPADPCALFLELETADGSVETPEVVPRMDGTTYICGLSGTEPLPVDPAHVELEEGAVERLRTMAATFSPDLGASEIIAEQACFRPITTDGVPIIGNVPDVKGAYVATGHSVWGMLNGPATGEAMAELIVDGAASTVDLSPFDPSRLL